MIILFKVYYSQYIQLWFLLKTLLKNFLNNQYYSLEIKRKCAICIFSFHLDSSFMSKGKNTKSFVLFRLHTLSLCKICVQSFRPMCQQATVAQLLLRCKRKLTRSLIKYIDKFHREKRSEERFPLCFILKLKEKDANISIKNISSEHTTST